MARVAFPVMVLFLTVTLACHVTTAFYFKQSSLANPSESKCLNYMNECSPWKSQCCDGLSCTNLRKGFCVYPLEICVCQLKHSYNLDDDYHVYG